MNMLALWRDRQSERERIDAIKNALLASGSVSLPTAYPEYAVVDAEEALDIEGPVEFVGEEEAPEDIKAIIERLGVDGTLSLGDIEPFIDPALSENTDY